MKRKGSVYQAYNDKNKAYVKYKITEKGSKIMNVKERNPKKPFKNIKKRGNRK